jgi:DNA-binding beta-propeller fold protein YncE
LRRRILSLLAALAISLSGGGAGMLGGAAPATAAWNPPGFDRSIGGSGLAGVYAWGLQYNPVTDEILVGDYFNFNVRRFDRDGNALGAFGRPATERSGQPYSLAVDPRDGSVYVPEIGDGQPRGYIAKYDRNGNFLYEFNVGARYYAWIAVDKDGYLYVADSHYWNDAGDPPKIRKYAVNDATKSVRQEFSFGTYGTGPGQLNTARGITVADNGDIFVVDGGNNVITQFSRTGQYIRTITGPFGGDLRGITLDEQRNTLWVVDADGANLEQFTFDAGTQEWVHVRSYGSEGEGPGQFADGGRQVDVSPDGNVWVADYGNFRIQRFTPGAPSSSAVDFPNPSTQPATGLLSKVRDIAITPQGDLMIADTWNHRFQKFDANGNWLGSWGRRNSRPPYGMNYPRGIGVDAATGDVWVANTREHTLRVYDSSMTYKFDVGDGQDSTRTGSLRWPLDVEFAGGVAYVADYIGDRVKAFSASTGTELWSVSSNAVHGVAVDAANDRMYTVSPARDRIDVYRLSTRSLLTSYGSGGTSTGRFSSPWDIELSQGVLYVSDVARNKVIAYSTSGSFQGEFGSTGNGPGQFRGPSGLDVDAQGRLYVADSSNYRVQVFSPSITSTNNGSAPALMITAPAKNATVPLGSVEITGTATDPDGVGSVEVSIRDQASGQVWSVASSAWASGGRWPVAALKGADRRAVEWRWVFPAGVEGRKYTARVRAYDAAGNLSTGTLPSVVFTVSGATPDVEAPVVTLANPRNQMYARPVQVAGSATDNRGVTVVQVAVRDRTRKLWWNPTTGGWQEQSKWVTLDPVPTGGLTADWTWVFDDRAAPGSGSYFLQSRAKDAAGSISANATTNFSAQ